MVKRKKVVALSIVKGSTPAGVIEKLVVMLDLQEQVALTLGITVAPIVPKERCVLCKAGMVETHRHREFISV